MQQAKQSMLTGIVTMLMIAFLIPLSLSAQNLTYRQLLEQAKTHIQQSEYPLAEKELKKAIRKNENGLEALRLLAKLFYDQKDWSSAEGMYEHILEYHPNNTEAHYFAGICKRELGRYQDPVRRKFTFRSAAKHFEAVIKQDSSYKLVYDEYAKLELLRKEYEKAINFCLKQINIHPQVTSPLQDIFKYYDFYLVHSLHGMTNVFTNSDSGHIHWLKSRHSIYDEYFLGEAYRRLKKFDWADSIFSNLLQRPLIITKIPIYLSRVRLYYQMHRDAEAEKDYWAALNAVQHFYELKFIFDDAKYIMSDVDLQVKLPNLQKIRTFYRDFWRRNTLFPGSSINMRLAEHYRRLIYAEKNFRYDEPRLQINNPDQSGTMKFPRVFFLNHTFNDKGLVYIRYGEPDDRAFSLGNNVESNESWLYHKSGLNPKLIFHFEIHPKAKPNDWRLVSVPSDASMIESRLGWDPALDTYYMAQTDLERASAISTIRMKSRKSVFKAMDRQRALTMNKINLLPLQVQAAQFWNELDEPYLNIYLSVPAKDLLTDSTDAAASSAIEAGFALLDEKGKLITKKTRAVSFNDIKSSQIHSNILEIFKTVPPQMAYFLTTHIRNKQNSLLGGIRIKMKGRKLDPKKLTLSDPVLAYSIEPTKRVNKLSQNGFDIQANPSGNFDKKNPVFLYYEIYNLQEVDGKSSYSIEQVVQPLLANESLVTKFLNLFKSGNNQRISISKQGETVQKIAQEYSALDFSAWGTGLVEIKIKITDLNRAQNAELKVKLKLNNE